MADLSDVQVLLDYRTLGEVYSEVGRDGESRNPFFEMYAGPSVPKEQFRNDEVEFIKLSRVNDPAPLNQRGNPARVLQPTGKSSARLHMINMFDKLKLSMDALQMLRHPTQWVLQDRGREEIAQQTDDMATRHSVTKQLFQAKYMAGVSVWVNADGDILESATGAAITIATGIPVVNTGQVPGATFGITGDIIDAAWDGAGTKILTQLDKLRQAAQSQGSEPPRHVFINAANKFWLRQNTEILAMYAAGQDRLDNALMGDTFEINGYTFHFVSNTYSTSASAIGYYVGLTQAIITPDPGDGKWLANGNGLQYVPTVSGVVQGEAADASNWLEVFGDFAYSTVGHDPPSIVIYGGSNWLFGMRSPKSIFCPVVDF